MALDYDGANTGVFTRGGKVTKYVNTRLAAATTDLPAELKAIADLFEAADMTDQIDGLYDFYERLRDAQTADRRRLAAVWDAILTDRDSVLDELAITQTDVRSVLVALVRRMLDDAETVDRSTVAIGAVAADAGNTGTGTILLTKRLDGYSAPVRGGPVVLSYAGMDSELAVTETMRFEVSTSAGAGAVAGRESVRWTGAQRFQDFDWRGEGSGPGPTLAVEAGGGILGDGGFELWTDTNTPTRWALAHGALAGTHVFRYATPYRGTYALELRGDGVATEMGVSQSVAGRLDPLRLYCLHCRAKRSTGAATGSFRVWLEGTGYTAGAANTVEVTVAALTTSYVLYSTFVLMPATVPSDLAAHVEVFDDVLESGESVFVDEVTLQPAVYHGGIAAAAVAGAVDPVRGDRWTSAVTNDGAGVFQEFFRRKYKVQLPSSGTPTIADSLAT